MSERISTTLDVSAVCFVDELGRVLTVRKVGTSAFQLPGGKPEPGETTQATAAREVLEEIGVVVDPDQLTYLGTWTADAANEPDTSVTGTIYVGQLAAVPQPAREIEELRWHDVRDVGREGLAPLLATRVLPALQRFLAELS